MKTNTQKGSVITIVEVAAVIVSVVIVGVYYLSNRSGLITDNSGSNDEQSLVGDEYSSSTIDVVVCTKDAKMCPDGSYVGRVAPKCEFKVCLSTTAPSITVLSPNGGESWKIGNKQTIRWTPTSGKLVDISIDSKKNCVLAPCPTPPAPGTNMPTINFTSYIAKGIDNSGIFNWVVGQYSWGGSNMTISQEGLYKLTVCPNVLDESHIPTKFPCDSSDNYFTITN